MLYKKKLQWNESDEFGEDKFVVFMGGLHILLAILRAIGVWLQGSGWILLIVNANITTEGGAECLLKDLIHLGLSGPIM